MKPPSLGSLIARIKVTRNDPIASGYRCHNTPSRGNRKRRRHPSWMRTRGRLQRALNRALPAEQMCKVVAVARKWRELHDTQ